MSAPDSGNPAAGKSTGGSGSELPANVRSEMEKSLGGDFSKVRVHPSSSVSETGGANAYTKGNDIYFAPGQYSPETTHGKKLLAHELTHVVQQRSGRTPVQADPKTGAAQQDLASQRAATGEKAPLK
jgi:hypothetical protein